MVRGAGGQGLEATEQVGDQEWQVRFGRPSYAAELLEDSHQPLKSRLEEVVQGLSCGSMVSVLVATSQNGQQPLIR
jgi:hypothetical protein